MHTFGFVVSLFVASVWVFHGLRVAYGSTKLPRIKKTSPAADKECPSISLIFAARDEEAKLPEALETLAALDYPRLEIIATDDRSTDGTGRILEEFAARNARFRAVHVAELPSGWLGKPHALQKGYEASSGEWLLFTDADVRFERSVLRRAMALARQNNLDHLTLLTDVEMHGFWETLMLTFFALAFYLANVPHKAGDIKSRVYMGVGAFQLLKRSVYEKVGTHRRLAMEVVDDMKLGKLVKLGGFRSGVAVAQELVSVRWHSGLRNVIRGVTKNFFAAFGYSVAFAMVAVACMLLLNVVPFIALFAGHGWIRVFSAIAVAAALFLHAGVDVTNHVSPLYAVTHPIGAILFCYMIVRSVAVTLWRGGVTWRGTFYPLEDLKRGVV
ncbi:MAG TPA: glycosyltransferase family 2 protein [Candidatus Methylomirabilis sp.]|nr:glycosyltransferase family 2 protein [Candidatus Methylomirabilis sp.]